MIGDAAKAHHVYGGVPDLAIRQQPSGAQAVISAISGSQLGRPDSLLGLIAVIDLSLGHRTFSASIGYVCALPSDFCNTIFLNIRRPLRQH
jgi:hypothetical protein